MEKRYKIRKRSFLPIVVLTVLSTLYFAYLTGCTQSSGTEQAMSPERQKAIEDSLLKAKEFDIAKNYSTAFEYYKNGNYSDAKKYFQRVINLDPQMRLANKFHYTDLYSRLANCYVQENKPDSVEFAYLNGLKHFPDDVYLHESLGFLLRRKNQFDDAIEHYKLVAKMEPEKAETYKILGDLYRRTQNADLAIESYENYVKLVPDDRDAQDTLTGLYGAAGRSEDALAKKEELLVSRPDDTTLMFDLGMAYFDQGNFNKSVELLTRLLDLDPKNIDALSRLAKAHLNLESYGQAINDYKKILAINRNDIGIICEVANVYRTQGDFQNARNWGRKALGVNSNSGLAYITIGKVYQESASTCVQKKGSFKYDDRLVYQKAYEEYRKASRDPFYEGQARQAMKSIEHLLPTAEDKHMNTYTEPKEACYSWI